MSVSDSFFFYTLADTLFQTVAHTLGTTSEGIERNAQSVRQSLSMIDLVALLILIILHNYVAALGRQRFQAALKTFILPILFFPFFFGRCQHRLKVFKRLTFSVRPFQTFKKN